MSGPNDKYDPSMVSSKFMASMTVAGLLGNGNLPMADGQAAGKRIAEETVHEERLRIMMKKLCVGLRESHFPGTRKSVVKANANGPTTTTTSSTTIPASAPAALNGRSTTTSALKSALRPQSRQHAADDTGTHRERNINATISDDQQSLKEVRITEGQTATLYPNYTQLTTTWAEDVLDEPHRYTEFLERQKVAPSALPSSSQGKGPITATLRIGGPSPSSTGLPLLKHPVEDDDERFTVLDPLIPSMPVLLHHLPPHLKPLKAKELAIPSTLVSAQSGTTSSLMIHHYTAPLLVNRQALPPISPFATLGKHTTGRKFQPVFPPDQRDHRVNQYTEEELEQFRLGERKMPDGPVVSDWRNPSDLSLTVLEKKRRCPEPISLCAALRNELAELEAQQEAAEAIAEKKRRTAEREATRLASLHKDVSSLRESLESVKVRVEQEALGVEALKVREWEKLEVGDSYRGIECINEECLPLGSPLKAVRQQRLLASR